MFRVVNKNILLIDQTILTPLTLRIGTAVAGNDWQRSIYWVHRWLTRWLPGMASFLPGMGYHQMAKGYHQMAMGYHQMVKGFQPKHILYLL
jgi:hypothetical protein